MNCSSCKHQENNCEYERFKKHIESEIYHMNHDDIYKLHCKHYEPKEYV